MKAGIDSHWRALRLRLKAAARSVELKKSLARELGVTLPAVYQYMTGRSAPKAETTLRLLEWVNRREQSTKKGTAAKVLRTPSRPRTRKP